MKKLLKLIMAGACLGGMATGCGQKEASEPTQPMAPLESMPLLSEPSAPAEPMPEGLSTPELATAPENTAPAREFLPGMEDEAGNPLTDSLAIMRHAVLRYEDDRYAVDPEQTGGVALPELKDLSQLIKYGYLKRLPAAPPGQRFVLDLTTKNVGLTNR